MISMAILHEFLGFLFRSIKARDPFYDDHIHDSKMHFHSLQPPLSRSVTFAS